MFKFRVYDFKGNVKDNYIVSQGNLGFAQANIDNVTKHHIIVVDRSGSMYYNMEGLKKSLKKILTLHEYNNDNTIVSLLSYSSSGDLQKHFIKKTPSEINADDVDKIYARGLTCISQSLEIIKEIIDPSQVTGITLHSDGFANDPSSLREKSKIEELCTSLSKENVFINTIAHTEYADYQLLSHISNMTSGKCVNAFDIKTLYDSIVETFDKLKSNSCVKVEIKLNLGESLVYINHAEKKIIGIKEDTVITGIDPKNPGVVYGLNRVSDEEYKRTLFQEKQNHELLYALAKYNLSDYNVNNAKYILASIGNKELFNKYIHASSLNDIKSMSMEIEKIVFDKTPVLDRETEYPIIIDDRLTVIDVLNMINEYRDSVLLNTEKLSKIYIRRGLKKLFGVRNEQGELEEPWLKTEALGDSDVVSINGLDISTTSPNISINTVQKVRLADKNGNYISKVGGILVDVINSYKSYNVVGDGELNITKIPIYISSKKAFDSFLQIGRLYEWESGIIPTEYKPEKVYYIDIEGIPITKISVDINDLENKINNYFVNKIIISLLDSMIKQESSSYTYEQIDELKKHYLSKNLYLNFPTVNEYTDLNEAIMSGKVDVQNSYKVKFGINGIYGYDSFRSANEFIDRIYSPNADHQEKKVKCDMLLRKYGWNEKQLSKRSKVTLADTYQKKIFDKIVNNSQSEKSIFEAIVQIMKDNSIDIDCEVEGNNYIKSFENLKRQLEKSTEEIYINDIFPILFFIGTFGMAPDNLNGKTMNYEELVSVFPDIAISKQEKDGMFYVYKNIIFGISPEKRYVTVSG